MKTKICNDAIVIRRGMSENESFRNEIVNLKENIDHLKIENQDLKKEVELLKDNVFSLEKQNIYLRNNFEEKEHQVEQITKE